MYEMKQEYLTGIKQIDEEHARLFEIAEEAYQLRKNEFIPDKYDNIREILRKLKEYTFIHFENEEKYMESIQYKRRFTQKVQHDAFRCKLDDIDIESIDEGSDEIIDEILQFLTDWLVEHILHTDKLINQ